MNCLHQKVISIQHANTLRENNVPINNTCIINRIRYISHT